MAEAMFGQVAAQLAQLTELIAKAECSRLDAGPGGKRRKLEMKNLKVSKFHGKYEDWSDWAFSFKRAVRAASLETYKLMSKVEDLREIGRSGIECGRECCVCRVV